MKMNLKIFKKEKHRYVLKARKQGKWEVLGEFDQAVGISDIRDLIDAALEDGYDAFRLEEVNEEGKRVRLVWTKYYKARKKEDVSEEINKIVLDAVKQTLPQAVQATISTISNVTGETIRTLMSAFRETLKELRSGGEKVSLTEIIADFLYQKRLMEKVLRVIAKEYFKAETPKKEEDKFMKFFIAMLAQKNPTLAQWLAMMMGEELPMMMPTMPMQIPMQMHMQMPQQAQQGVQATSPPPSPQAEEEEEDVAEIKKKAMEIASRIVEETRNEVAKEIAACETLGICTEEEEPPEEVSGE